MLRGYLEKAKKSSAPVPMRVFSGKCAKKVRQPIVGRLVFEESIDSFSGSEAFFAVLRGDREPDIPHDTRIVGVVRLSEDGGKKYELPCPVITLCALPEEYDGKIALLDTCAETLFVSPDIFTVNRYTALLASKNPPRRGLPIILRNGKEIKIMEAVRSVSEISDRGSGYLLDMPAYTFGTACKDEELYEIYRDAAELSVGRSVTIIADTDKCLSDRLRAVMRGAVFGNISLCFRGILTEAELKDALDCFCKAFCELEIEGREFNGYIKRGLMIDTPYLLRIAPYLRGVDFFIYDTKRLIYLMSGERKKAPAEITAGLLGDICSVINLRGELCHSVVLGRATATSDFCQRLGDCEITDYFAPTDIIESVIRVFEGITNEA